MVTVYIVFCLDNAKQVILKYNKYSQKNKFGLVINTILAIRRSRSYIYKLIQYIRTYLYDVSGAKRSG